MSLLNNRFLKSKKGFTLIRLRFLFNEKKRSCTGFTLIELMVVITIIALMFGIVISSANFLRSASADAKRKADLASIQSALQNYYADLNYFPQSTETGSFKLSGTGASTTLTSTVGLSSPAPVPSPLLKTYMKEVPIDPATPYCYVAVNNSRQNDTTCNNTTAKRCNYYYIAVELANPTTTMILPTGVTCTGMTPNYFVSP